MKRAAGHVFLALLIASAAMAQTRQRAVRAAAPVPPWTVEITTSGGFGGGGFGSIAVASDGSMTVTSQAKKPCTYRLTPSELERIQGLVLSAKADYWVASYVPASGGCCDLYFHHLKMTRREQYNATYNTDWAIDHAAMPADLKSLAQALVGYPDGLLQKYLPICTQ